MRTTKIWMVVLAALAATDAVGKPPRGGAPDRPPFPCYAEVWRGSFAFQDPRYSSGERRLVWELEVKKQVRPGSFRAYVTDVDGVEQAVVPVKFEPAAEEYEEGAKIRAIVQLPRGLDAEAFGKLEIQARRK